MYSLIKQNLFIHNMYSYGTLLVMITFAHLIMFPPIFSYIIIAISMLVTFSYYDDKSNVNQFLISLPIAKRKVVLSRYLSVAIISASLLLYQWLIMISLSHLLSSSRYLYEWNDVITVYGITLLLTAVFIPVYHIFRSPHIATGVILFLFFIGTLAILEPLVNVLGMDDYIIFNELDAGFALLVATSIPFQPYFTFLIVSLTIFYLSIKLSQMVFSSKDQ